MALHHSSHTCRLGNQCTSAAQLIHPTMEARNSPETARFSANLPGYHTCIPPFQRSVSTSTTLPACQLLASRLRQEAHGGALIEQSQLAGGVLGIRGVAVNASVEQGAVEIAHQGANVAGRVRLAIFSALWWKEREEEISVSHENGLRHQEGQVHWSTKMLHAQEPCSPSVRFLHTASYYLLCRSKQSRVGGPPTHALSITHTP